MDCLPRLGFGAMVRTLTRCRTVIPYRGETGRALSARQDKGTRNAWADLGLLVGDYSVEAADWSSGLAWKLHSARVPTMLCDLDTTALRSENDQIDDLCGAASRQRA